MASQENECGVSACRQRKYEIVRRRDGHVAHTTFASSDLQAFRLLTLWADTHLASWCDYFWRSLPDARVAA